MPSYISCFNIIVVVWFTGLSALSGFHKIGLFVELLYDVGSSSSCAAPSGHKRSHSQTETKP